MYIKEEYNFNDLLNKCWSGAIDTFNFFSFSISEII